MKLPPAWLRPLEQEPVRRRTGLWGWVMTAIGLAAVLAAGWWVTNSPLFDLRSLDIRGNARLADRVVARAAGLDEETNVLWFSTGSVERRLERNPWIRTARVSRSLPGSVRVVIEERTAVAVVAMGDERVLMAGDGTVLGEYVGGSALPLLRSASGQDRDLAVGTDLLRVAAGLPGELRAMVSHLSVDADVGVVLSLRGGGRAVIGEASALGAKSGALMRILRWATERDVRPAEVDVRSPLAPALVPA